MCLVQNLTDWTQIQYNTKPRQDSTVQYNPVQYRTVQYSTIQYSTMYNTMQHSPLIWWYFLGSLRLGCWRVPPQQAAHWFEKSWGWHCNATTQLWLAGVAMMNLFEWWCFACIEGKNTTIYRKGTEWNSMFSDKPNGCSSMTGLVFEPPWSHPKRGPMK